MKFDLTLCTIRITIEHIFDGKIIFYEFVDKEKTNLNHNQYTILQSHHASARMDITSLTQTFTSSLDQHHARQHSFAFTRTKPHQIPDEESQPARTARTECRRPNNRDPSHETHPNHEYRRVESRNHDEILDTPELDQSSHGLECERVGWNRTRTGGRKCDLVSGHHPVQQCREQ